MLSVLVQEIYESGMTEAAIALACGTTQPTIHRIRKRKTLNTMHTLAEAIKALHAERGAQGLIPAKVERVA